MPTTNADHLHHVPELEAHPQPELRALGHATRALAAHINQYAPEDHGFLLSRALIFVCGYLGHNPLELIADVGRHYSELVSEAQSEQKKEAH